MTTSTTEAIKNKLDIVELLKGYISLQPAGKNFKARCPFHQEKTPSFMVSPERQSWHCFGCGIGGDIFSFVMRYENLEFAEAMKILAEKAGLELQRLSPQEYKFFGLLYDLNSAAKDFYIKELESSPVALNYLKERGLKEETIKEFEVGFAPSTGDALNLYFINHGYNSDDVLRAGLAIKTDRGKQFDRFRGRIMFPIHNNMGKIVGFTGRILPQLDDGKMGKYINSPETPIFNKSKVLYGFHKSKDYIRESKSVFLVEGQTDLLMSWQSGVKNVVASSGTALSSDHLRILKRLTDNLLLSFDSDEAGMNAGERAIDLAENMDYNVKVAAFSGFKDAAEAAKANPENIKKALDSAKSAPEFYFDKYLRDSKKDFSNREELQNIRAVLAKLKNIASPIAQDHWLRELSQRTGLEVKVLTEEAEKLEGRKIDSPLPNNEESKPLDRKLSRWDLICERLLSVAANTGNLAIVEGAVQKLTPNYQKIFQAMKAGEKKTGDSQLDEAYNLIALRSEELGEDEIEDLKSHLTKEFLKEKRKFITAKIKAAEVKSDAEALKSALQELNQLSST